MKKWFILIVCLWAFQASAQGTYAATSCSQAAVQAAITSEQSNPKNGDIILIPAGSCTWTAGISVTFNNSVTIQGAGAISATTGGASTTSTSTLNFGWNMGVGATGSGSAGAWEIKPALAAAINLPQVFVIRP